MCRAPPAGCSLAACVRPQRSLCQARRSLCRGLALSVSARRSLCRAPALCVGCWCSLCRAASAVSVWGPGALTRISVSSLCRAPALCLQDLSKRAQSTYVKGQTALQPFKTSPKEPILPYERSESSQDLSKRALQPFKTSQKREASRHGCNAQQARFLKKPQQDWASP